MSEEPENIEEGVRPEPHWSALPIRNIVGMLLGALIGGNQVEIEEVPDEQETSE